MNTATKRQILRIPDVAELFKVDTDTVRRWIQKKQIPAQKIGGQWFFDLEIITKTFDEPIPVTEIENN